MVNSREATVAALGVAAALGGAYMALKWQQHRWDQPPSDEKWRQVGSLADLVCFPVKSCGVVRVGTLFCSKLGPTKGRMRDRTFVIVDSQKNFETARTHPKMTLIQPTFEGDYLVLSAPGMDDIKVKIPVETEGKSDGNVTYQGQALPSVDCGDEVAEWISRYLGKPGESRLVYYPEQFSLRNNFLKNEFPTLKDKDMGAYTDLASFCLINEESVKDLNKKLIAQGSDPVQPLDFRANFVIDSNEPYAEDNWNWVKIGDAVFRSIGPCGRCLMVTVNNETGTRSRDQQPLKLLKQYRNIHTRSPTMGRYLALRKEANVSVGDPVYVA